MCALILLAIIGFFGVFGIGSTTAFSTTAMVAPAVVEAGSGSLVDVLPEPPDNVIECESVIPPEADKFLVETFRSDVLSEADGWMFTFDDTQMAKTVGTWLNTDLGAVAYMELLHYDCGLPPNVVDQYFSPEAQAISLSNYDSYELVSYCTRAETTLYVFETSDNGADYETRYWFQLVEPSRVIMLLLTTPVSRSAEVAPMLEELFPALPNCRNAGAG
jgi:hypothetical protein